MEFKKGQIWTVDLGKGIGSEQEGERPCLIIQNDVGNAHSQTLIVACITTKKRNRKLPTHVNINCLSEPSTILCEQVRTIDKKRVKDYSSKLSAYEIKELDKALMVSMGISI